MPRIAIFYHIAIMGVWQDVDDEITTFLHRSGLLANADVLVRNEVRDTDLYEFPTLEMLHTFSINNPDYYCLYLHTKGVSRPSTAVDDWRRCMLFFLVEHWEENVKALRNGYDACGVNLLKKPTPHFQGNYFWAKASYISTLGNVRGMVLPRFKAWGERHKCEMWPLSNPKVNVFNFYSHVPNPYVQENPISNYKDYVF